MRLKLVIIASLIAATVGTGLAILIIFFLLESPEPIASPGPPVMATYLLPLIFTFAASFFVYRHTARRRRLQAALTAIISLLLTLTLFVVASILTSRNQPVQPPAETPRNST